MSPVLTAAPAARPPADAVRVQAAALLADVPLPLDAAVVACALAVDAATAHRHLLALAADDLAQDVDGTHFRAAPAGGHPAGAMDAQRRHIAARALTAACQRALSAVLTADPLTARRARSRAEGFGLGFTRPERARQWLHSARPHLTGLREHAAAAGEHHMHWVSALALTQLPAGDTAGRLAAVRAALPDAAADGTHALRLTRLHLARLLSEAGDNDAARSLAFECLRAGVGDGVVHPLYEMGAAEHAGGDHDSALRTLRAAQREARAEKDEAAAAMAMLLRGSAVAALGGSTVGIEYLTRARAVLVDAGFRVEAARALAALGRARMLARDAGAGSVLAAAAAELAAVGAEPAHAQVLTWRAALTVPNAPEARSTGPGAVRWVR
nr:hypothetical protein KPHV_86200 [Kitasatospora purpeofusca]